MKITQYLAVSLVIALSACSSDGSGESGTADSDKTGEIKASAEDIELVEETESIKTKATAATATADSILNAL